MNLASRIFLFAYTAAMVSVATGFYAQHNSEGRWPVTLSSWGARSLGAEGVMHFSLCLKRPRVSRCSPGQCPDHRSKHQETVQVYPQEILSPSYHSDHKSREDTHLQFPLITNLITPHPHSSAPR